MIKEASLLHNDPRIAALCTDDLIAEEVAYHKSCYWDFKRIVTANKQGTAEEENEGELDNSFDAVKDFIEVAQMSILLMLDASFISILIR